MEEERTVPLLPAEYVFACVDSAADAADAAARLRAAGIHAQDIQFLDGRDAARRLDIACEHCNIVVRLLRLVWRFGTTEGLLWRTTKRRRRRGTPSSLSTSRTRRGWRTSAESCANITPTGWSIGTATVPSRSWLFRRTPGPVSARRRKWPRGAPPVSDTVPPCTLP